MNRNSQQAKTPSQSGRNKKQSQRRHDERQQHVRVKRHAAGGYFFRNAKLPEPIERVNKAKGWVEWGKKNTYPQWLTSLLYASGIHSGIINQKVKFVMAGGIEYVGTDADAFNAVSVNPEGDRLADIIRNAAFDFETLESFAYHFKKDIRSGRWYAYPMDVALIRPDETDPWWHYSENWAEDNQSYDKTAYRVIPDISDLLPEDTECLVYYKTMAKQYVLDNGKLTCNYFPVPSYNGAIKDICTSIEISHFHYSETVNGYKGGLLVNFNNGIPTDAVRREMELVIKAAATNRDTQGGIAFSWNEGKERATTFEQMNGNDLDRRYLTTDESITQKIMVGHSVINPVLWGVKTDNALGGGSDELMTAYYIYKENHAIYRQQALAREITRALNILNKLTGEVKFKDYVPNFSPKAAEPATVSTPAEPTTEEVLSEFERVGRGRAGFRMLHSRGIEKFDNIEASEQEFISSFTGQRFATPLTEVQSRILELISEREKYSDIVRATGLAASQVTKHLIALERAGYIDSSSGKMEITSSGSQAIATKETLRVVYTYEKRPDAPNLVPGGTSRDFCKSMLRMDKVYTRDEINAVSDAVGRDVWLYRGGWYHDPTTGNNQPSCRHYWKQHLIIEK